MFIDHISRSGTCIMNNVYKLVTRESEVQQSSAFNSRAEKHLARGAAPCRWAGEPLTATECALLAPTV